MKTCIGTFLLAFFFLSCKREHADHWKNTLFVFYQSTDSSLCDARRSKEECANGKLFLTSEGKALYFFYCRNTDSISYFRGTYKISDSSVHCVFDSRLNRGKDPQKERLHFQEIARRTIVLKPTGCEAGYAQLFTTDLHFNFDTVQGRKFSFFTKADLSTYKDFCENISVKPSLVDFQCQPGGDSAYHESHKIDDRLVNFITDHYKNKNPKSRMHKADNDSVVELSFTYNGRKKRGNAGPYLYVTIPKNKKTLISGDLSKDGTNEVIVAPRLSEGGETFWQDIFVFSSTDGKYDMLQVVSAMDIARCTGISYNGAFVPEKIKDGLLIGTTTCFTDDDAACCPSVKIQASYAFTNKKLKLVKPK